MTARQKTPEDSGRNAEEVVVNKDYYCQMGMGRETLSQAPVKLRKKKNSGLRDALSCILSSTKRWKQIDKLSVHKAA